MNITYKVVDMVRDSETGVVKLVKLQLYLEGRDDLVPKEIMMELGEPTGDLIPFSNIKEADVTRWLLNNEEALRKLTEASEQIEKESGQRHGLPW